MLSLTPSNKISSVAADEILFVTFLHQGKKVKAFYFEGNLRHFLFEGVKQSQAEDRLPISLSYWQHDYSGTSVIF
jgi:hypothetical protein